MKYFKILFLSAFIFSACKDANKKKLITKDNNGIISKGLGVQDSIFVDSVFYFNQNNELIGRSFFNYGKLEGVETYYYTNGLPRLQTSYTSGNKNGCEKYFDSLGRLRYSGNFYFNLAVGPIVFYDTTQAPKRFFFANLQNETLLDIDYKSWIGIEAVFSNCINYTYNIQRRDSAREGSLLLYLINPPKLRFNYSILKIQKKDNSDFSIVSEIKNDAPFKDLILPILPDSLYYSIRLNIYDSILNKKTVINKEVW